MVNEEGRLFDEEEDCNSYEDSRRSLLLDTRFFIEQRMLIRQDHRGTEKLTRTMHRIYIKTAPSPSPVDTMLTIAVPNLWES